MHFPAQPRAPVHKAHHDQRRQSAGTRLAAAERVAQAVVFRRAEPLLRRRRDENRGDEFDGWGRSVWYFEVGDYGWPVRQIEVYESGRVLRYGAEHEEDRYGGLDPPLADWEIELPQ
jgi:hypothetical protein